MSLKKNSLINILFSILQIGVLFTTIPIYLKTFGYSGFGSIALIWLVVGSFALFDFGITKYTIIGISGAKNPIERDAYITTGIYGAVLIGVCIFIIGFLITLFIPYWMVVDIQNKTNIEISSIWIILGILPIQLISNVSIGILDGSNRFGESNKVQFVGYVLFQLMPLIVAYIFDDKTIKLMVFVVLISKIISMLILLKKINIFQIKFEKFFFNKKLNQVKKAILLSKWISINSFITYFAENADKYMITILRGSQELALYIIPFNLLTKSRILPEAISRGSFPLYVKQNTKERKDTCVFITNSLLEIAGFGLGIFLFISNEFYIHWIGPINIDLIQNITFILIIGLIINASAYSSFTLLESTGRSIELFNIYKITTIIYVLYLYVLTNEFGLIGAATAWTIRVAFDSMFLIFKAIGFEKTKAILIKFFIIISTISIAWFSQNIFIIISIAFIFVALLVNNLLKLKSDTKMM